MKILTTAAAIALLSLPVLVFAGQVDINTADAEAISTELKGVGLSKAKAIVERYQHRPKEELYDLRSDPYETNNLAANPDQTELLISLRKQLAQWCKTQGDDAAIEVLDRIG